MQKIYRHGDVLIVAVDEIPDGAKKASGKNGKIILAWGEATGHHHAIAADPWAQGFMVKDELYLNLKKPAKLTHQEHATIELPKGKFRVIHQVEYSRKELQRVID